jgi:hypothetical protein
VAGVAHVAGQGVVRRHAQLHGGAAITAEFHDYTVTFRRRDCPNTASIT